MGDGLCDVRVLDGRIAQLGTGLVAGADAQVLDGQGGLLLPGLVEAHTHLDKTQWGLPWWRNTVGPALKDRIEADRTWRVASGLDAHTQSLGLAKAFLANGTTRLRTHVDVDTQAGLQHFEGVMRTKAAMSPWMDIQVVVFPQSGMLGRPGTAALLEQALLAGADVLGGLDPQGIEGDGPAALDVLFGIAQRTGKPMDIHLHEPGELGAQSLGWILDRVQAQGLQGQVMISHCYCLGDIAHAQRDALLARMAQLQVSIATSGTASRPVPDLRACHQAQVLMAGGNDGIRDTWGPYGTPDMLERAKLIAWRYDFYRDEDIELALHTVTDHAAQACGFANYGLQVGARADLVVVQAQCAAEAVIAKPERQWVIAAGEVVARNGKLLENCSLALA